MMSSIEQFKRGIAVEAPRVSREAAEHQAAIETERRTEAEVLAHCIELVRPALKALCNRMLRSDSTRTVDGKPYGVSEAFVERGLHLSGSAEPQAVQTFDEFSGTYCGHGLFLLDDGRLADRSWSGSWSKYQGSTSSWTSALNITSPLEAMQTYGLQGCLERLLRALQQQHRSKHTQAAEERTARLQAVLALVK